MNKNNLIKAKISDFFELKQGFAFPSKHFSKEEGLLVIKIKNVKSDGLDLSEKEFVPIEYSQTHKEFVPKDGDLLVSLSGNRYEGSIGTWAGKVSYYNKHPTCIINQRVGILRKKKGLNIEPQYFSYLLSTLEEQIKLIRIATSSGGQANLSKEQILSYEVNIHSFKEQRAIATILSTLDEKIKLNKQTNETLEDLAKLLFKSWFIDFDPVRIKAEGHHQGLPNQIADLFPDSFEDSELGMIPKGWKIGNLDQIAFNRREIIKPTQIDSSSRHIGLEHMPRESIDLRNFGSTENIASNKNIFKKGDILYGKLRPYFKKTGFAQFDGVCSTDIVVVKEKFELHNGFICFLLASNSFINFTVSLSSGTRMPRTSWNQMCEYLLPLPKPPLIKTFGNIVLPILNKIRVNSEQSKSLTLIKDTLLPKLISGEIRIHDAEKIIEEAGI